MKNNILLLALPNSGSTWLGDIIARHTRLRYFPEYFNPLRNPNHEPRLARTFGCELASCYQNIASPGDALTHDDILATWAHDGFEFTKEVFSPFKLPVFARHFQCAALLRKTEGTFHPSRLRIWSFYEHAWYALKDAGHKLSAVSVRAKSYEAHQVMSDAIRSDAADLGVPVIEHETLFGSEREVTEVLSRLMSADDANSAAREVVATRRAKNFEAVAA